MMSMNVDPPPAGATTRSSAPSFWKSAAASDSPFALSNPGATNEEANVGVTGASSGEPPDVASENCQNWTLGLPPGVDALDATARSDTPAPPKSPAATI